MVTIKQIIQAQKSYLYEKYGATEIGVFGSYVQGHQTADSDIDILIELTDPPQIDLLDLVDLENYLSDIQGDGRRARPNYSWIRYR